MFKWFKTWRKRREQAYGLQEKARLCKPCDELCGRELCRKIGCLNMDMRVNSTRLGLLVMRLEDTGYVFATNDEPKKAKVVNIADFRR